jgi:hypothetical protein
MKKIREDKQIGVKIHPYMEISQRNSLYSYLYLKQAKMSCFSFYLFLFSPTKIGEQRGGTSSTQRRGLAALEGGSIGKMGWEGKRCSKMCKHASKCKNDTC